MNNIVEMFGIEILEHDGYVDPFDDGNQYKVNKWLLDDMEKYKGMYAVIGFNGSLKIYKENGDEMFNGTLLDSTNFVVKLKEKIS